MACRSNRLALLLAVLEKRVGYQLHSRDVFVSVAGGVRIFEPAIDLGIILAVASSLTNKNIDPSAIAVGEVGLGGELRSVARMESRLKEAEQLGFKTAVIPKRNSKDLLNAKRRKIKIIGVELVEEAIKAILQ